MLDAIPSHLCAELELPWGLLALGGQRWIQADSVAVQQYVLTGIPSPTAARVQRCSLQAMHTVPEQTELESAIATHAKDGTWK